MTTPSPKVLALLAASSLLIVGANHLPAVHLPTVHAAPQAISPAAPNVAAGEAEAKRLILLMDRDQSGKVSRKEYMDYMAAEFERLDINHDGELDVKELTQSQFVPAHGGAHR